MGNRVVELDPANQLAQEHLEYAWELLRTVKHGGAKGRGIDLNQRAKCATQKLHQAAQELRATRCNGSQASEQPASLPCKADGETSASSDAVNAWKAHVQALEPILNLDGKV